MKFREYDKVEPRIVTATTPEELTLHIDEIGKEFNIIDLQYSTTTNWWWIVQYSALLLISK